MPTKRRRHAITETPPVERALEPLRDRLADERIDWGELVILGAQAKLARLDAERAETLGARNWLAERIREGDPLVDPDAAAEVRLRGWTR